MTITWEEIIAMLSIAVAISGLFSFITHLMIKGSLADFLIRLNGTYVRTPLYDARQLEVERRLVALEHRIPGNV